jgi:hypothetical protein
VIVDTSALLGYVDSAEPARAGWGARSAVVRALSHQPGRVHGLVTVMVYAPVFEVAGL